MDFDKKDKEFILIYIFKAFFFSLKTFNTNLGSQEHLKVCFWAAHNLIKKKKSSSSLFIISVQKLFYP